MDYHDALADLCVGSAHPGGYLATLAWLATVDFQAGMRVLEVGCGTGRTACQIASYPGVLVTAVESRTSMLDRARKRAQDSGVEVTFRLVDSERLPFDSRTFDLVVAESVTVFNDVPALLQEYARVLVPGGIAIDTEMCAAAPLPEEVMEAFHRTYGALRVPTQTQWKGLWRAAGFDPVRVLSSGPVTMDPARGDIPDLWSMTQTPVHDQEVWRIVEQNQMVMSDHAKWLQYAVIRATRQTE